MTRLAKPEKKAGKGNERREIYAKDCGKAMSRGRLNYRHERVPQEGTSGRRCQLVVAVQTCSDGNCHRTGQCSGIRRSVNSVREVTVLPGGSMSIGHFAPVLFNQMAPIPAVRAPSMSSSGSSPTYTT